MVAQIETLGLSENSDTDGGIQCQTKNELVILAKVFPKVRDLQIMVNFDIRNILVEIRQLSLVKLSLTILETEYKLAVPTDWVNIDFAKTFPKIRNLKVKCCKENTVFGNDNIALLGKLEYLETLEIGYVCSFGIFKELAALFERRPKLRIQVDHSKVKLSAKEIHEMIVSRHPIFAFEMNK
jgi:hypothetical protein